MKKFKMKNAKKFWPRKFIKSNMIQKPILTP